VGVDSTLEPAIKGRRRRFVGAEHLHELAAGGHEFAEAPGLLGGQQADSGAHGLARWVMTRASSVSILASSPVAREKSRIWRVDDGEREPAQAGVAATVVSCPNRGLKGGQTHLVVGDR
jgi:hypothetical protein